LNGDWIKSYSNIHVLEALASAFLFVEVLTFCITVALLMSFLLDHVLFLQTLHYREVYGRFVPGRFVPLS